MMCRRSLLAAGALPLLARPSLGQGRFPDRPVRFLIPWAPGGTLDGFMRLQAEMFQQEFGQPLIIENRPGALAVAPCAPGSWRRHDPLFWRA